MEWLFSLAIIPVLLCGLMCAVPMALAALGMRRRATKRACCDEPSVRAPQPERVDAAPR